MNIKTARSGEEALYEAQLKSFLTCDWSVLWVIESSSEVPGFQHSRDLSQRPLKQRAATSELWNSADIEPHLLKTPLSSRRCGRVHDLGRQHFSQNVPGL